jgi:uncharacterized protein with ParB-like and HNH nuclease domain
MGYSTRKGRTVSRVYPELKSVRALLSAKYGLDFYQREYEWKRENIEELFNDLETKFMSAYSPDHAREQVQNYPHYFLGTIITCLEASKKSIVDGQQRLTTLTLLLIYLHHLQSEVSVKELIFSERYGRKSFNLDVRERSECMDALYEVGTFDANGHKDLSVQNLVARYTDIQEQFPESLTGDVLPYFVDWLVDNVDLVDIEAGTDDDAFTIFETMNDRGVSLDSTDMLKGYLLGNINDVDADNEHERKSRANELWKTHIRDLREVMQARKEGYAAFFKDWLRAKYAETVREGSKGAKNRDFENIDKFHRWVRDERNRIGLRSSQDFYTFITKNFDHFARHYLRIMRASEKFDPAFEYIFYNAYNGFTFQPSLLLAPITLDDDEQTVATKMRLVSGFIDIFVVRRIVNFRTLSYSSIKYTIFNLIKRIRDKDADELARILRDEVASIPETLDGVRSFWMHQQNRRQVHYILARMTYHIEQQSGIPSSFATYVSRDIKKPFQVEHLWGNIYERHEDEFPSVEQFQRYRNNLGGLILIPKGFNQSFGADTYEEKVAHYYGQNLLARTLHEQCYHKNPSFRTYMQRSGLPFQPYGRFRKADMDERQELYRMICEEIWSPDRFDRELHS